MERTTDYMVIVGLSTYTILPSVYSGGTHMITKIEPGNNAYRNVTFGTRREMVARIKEIKELAKAEGKH